MIGWRLGLACITVALAVLGMEVLVGRAVPLRAPLTALPFHILHLTGRAEEIAPEVWQRTRPDEAVNRQYMDRSGRAVNVFVAYYERDASRVQVLAVCPAYCEVLDAGLEVIDVEGRSIVVDRARVRQNDTEQVVLYWFQSGRHIAYDATLAKLDRIVRAFRSRRSDGALVRISAPVDTTEQDARERSVAFAKALLPMLRRYLPE